MKSQIPVIFIAVCITNSLALSSRKDSKQSHTEKYFEKFKKDEKEANRLIQRAIIAATKKKDTNRLKIGRQHLYEAMHKKTSIDGYLNHIPTGSSHQHTPYSVYMPNDYKVAELTDHKIPTYSDLTFDIKHMLQNANMLKMKSDQLKHKANILEHEASMLDATRAHAGILPVDNYLEKKPVMEPNKVISPAIFQSLVTTSPHEDHHERVHQEDRQEQHHHREDSHERPMTVNHAVEAEAFVPPNENNGHSSPHIVTVSKTVEEPLTQHVEVSNSLASEHDTEPNRAAYENHHLGTLDETHGNNPHVLTPHRAHHEAAATLPLIDIDPNQRLKSGVNGQGPERGGSAASPTIPAVLTDIKEGPTKVKVDSGYPVYHIPSTEEETTVTEYDKPVPPRDGVNPYEVLTSSSLKKPVHKKLLLSPTMTSVGKVVEPAPLIQNFVKSNKFLPAIPKFLVSKVKKRSKKKKISLLKKKAGKNPIMQTRKHVNYPAKFKGVTHKFDGKKKNGINHKNKEMNSHDQESKSHITHAHKHSHNHNHNNHHASHNHASHNHGSHKHGSHTFGAHKLTKQKKLLQAQVKKIKVDKKKYNTKKTKRVQLKKGKKDTKKKIKTVN